MSVIVTRAELVQMRENFRHERKKVVFTNGCFDIVHRGHVDYLTKAKALGDVLLVGMNTDASVRRLKGTARPIVCQDDRAFVLAAFRVVDYICLFDEDTPYELIKAIVPDVLVKGSDWKIDSIVGKDIVEAAGGTVQTIDFVPNRSTTDIIKKIVSSKTTE
jgi:D-beta-D-heptose 7-phosphate kinase/D-beta-D-heptose 1-phosphate adenosyltransferase